MIGRNEILSILDDYNLNEVTIGVLGSHSALDICSGAKEEGFKTLVVCQRGRDKTYSEYYKSHNGLGVIDETIILDRFSDITNPDIIKQLQDKNTIFIPHRSFEVYVGFERIENDFEVPLFGTRRILRAEERDAPNNQYNLMKKAGIPYPRVYNAPDEIDRLCIIKVVEAERPYERAFFFASSPGEYREKSGKLIEEKRITRNALDKAVIEEFVLGTQVNFNYFYSPLDGRLELLGTDTRRQTNLDGLLRLPAQQQLGLLDTGQGIAPVKRRELAELISMAKSPITTQFIEAGHIACTVKESLLEQIFELGENFVRVSQDEYPPGIIGPFALQSVFKPGPPRETAVVFDISLRAPGSPGTKFTPYSGYLHRESLSVGRRIAMEIKRALGMGRVKDIVT